MECDMLVAGFSNLVLQHGTCGRKECVCQGDVTVALKERDGDG